MRIAVLLDRGRLFRWHLALIEALRGGGHDVFAQFRDSAEVLPASLTAILDFDHVRMRVGPDRFSTHLLPNALAAYRAPETFRPELTIDLSTASFEAAANGRWLRPLYDGSAKDHTLFHALLNGAAPRLSISDTGVSEDWIIGWPAIEQPARFALSLDHVSSRVVEGLIRVVANIGRGQQPTGQRFGAAAGRRPSSILSAAGRFAASRGARKLMRVREKLAGDEAKWHVAWRKIDTPSPPRPGLLDLTAYKVLPDDGARYYADPFVYVHQRALHVFVEEVPNATGRGIISHFTMGADGQVSKPVPVLEASHHLSYPFVFSRDGTIWMMPDAHAGGGLDLYRAVDFPSRWEKAQRLIDAPLHDATLFSHAGYLWIAATARAFQGASWDALSLYYAETLLGPWTPHAQNPVLIDAAGARPAGPVFEAGIDVFRPAQDCSQAYGGKTTLKRIVRLDPEHFEEESAGAIAFAGDIEILGPHTLSRGGGYEFVDLYARPSALRAGYQAKIKV
jgi:hypothetical protein